MQSTKDLIESDIKINHSSAAKDLISNPSFVIIKNAVLKGVLSHTPGTISGEYVAQEMFYNTGLTSLFSILEAASVEDITQDEFNEMIELEAEPDLDVDSPFDV